MSQSVYLFTTIVAFFSGVISAPIFMYLSNNYYDYMIGMGRVRVTLSLFIFWLMLTIIFAVFLSEVSGLNTAKSSSSKKSLSKGKKR